MYTLLKPIIESRVRRNIIMSVEETVRKVLTVADERLFQLRSSVGASSIMDRGQGAPPSTSSAWEAEAAGKSAGDVGAMGPGSADVGRMPVPEQRASQTPSGGVQGRM